MRARLERRARFVEANVSVVADPEEHQVESAGGRDRAFVAIAFGVEVTRAAVGKMGLGG
ncbi:hypothetical protein D3C83_177220 [compost metagenome]